MKEPEMFRSTLALTLASPGPPCQAKADGAISMSGDSGQFGGTISRC